MAYFDYLRELAGLTPASNVLDIGSGLGRKSWPLIGFLETGEYLGIEPRRDAVQWCTRNITRQDPRLRFEHIDVRNGYYTPQGSRDASTATLSAETGKYDIVMANSVFTHMLPAEINNYLRECRRVLVPGGRLLCTFFMTPDEPSILGPTVSPARYQFPHHRDGYRVQHDNCDEHVVNYDEHDVRSMYDNAGIKITDIHWGSWRGNKEFLDFQDIVIGEKI
ncbi:class I SAM-dependent methyltransferase [Mangrovactinospora gilvigrisea]|uniref:class I SAM-dependent methyltransferase n=1 Tax=Mangrovactinospora gilvigrisea TaxID=1428644 RepID=UPI0008FCD701|nr:methyltransferase domain-containing protein [Mangrovactinospora gilvigrisea]